MRNGLYIRSGFLALGFSFLLSATSSSAAELPSSTSKPKLYDTAADGNRQIAEALKIAKAQDNRLILKFGANW